MTEAERQQGEEPAPKKRRPYQKPGSVGTVAFERRSLACGSKTTSIPGGCNFNS